MKDDYLRIFKTWEIWDEFFLRFIINIKKIITINEHMRDSASVLLHNKNWYEQIQKKKVHSIKFIVQSVWRDWQNRDESGRISRDRCRIAPEKSTKEWANSNSKTCHNKTTQHLFKIAPYSPNTAPTKLNIGKKKKKQQTNGYFRKGVYEKRKKVKAKSRIEAP